MEGMHVTIEPRGDDHRQSNAHDGLNIYAPTLGRGGYHSFEAGCPAFTHELRQVGWQSARTFKLEIPEKYDGRLNPVEFLSIYTIAVQATGGRDEKVFANYFLWRSSQMCGLG